MSQSTSKHAVKRAVEKAKAWKEVSGIDPEIQSPSEGMRLENTHSSSGAIPIYHGTSATAAQKIRETGFSNRFDVSLYGGGVYGTSDPEQAKHYATMKGGATGEVMQMAINPNELEDLGEFPKGNSKAIDSLYAKARQLRQEKRSLMIRSHPRYGDLVILDPELATRSLS